MLDSSRSVVTVPLGARPPAERRAVAAFREVAAAIAEERDLDTVLHLIVRKLCELTGSRRCSVHLLDSETGLLHGQVAHSARDIDSLVKRLVSGAPGDGFTREILATHRPVALVNAPVDPRAVRKAMRRWSVQSVLGVPMILRDEVIGIVYLDNEDVSRVFSPIDQELAVTFAELAATAVIQVQLTTRLRASLATVDRQVRQLRQAARMEEQLTEIILNGAGLGAIGDVVSRLLAKPCVIYNAAFRRLVASRAPGSGRVHEPRLFDEDVRNSPGVAEIIDGLKPGRPEIIGPLPWLGLHHRHLVCVVMVNGERWGYVVVTESPGRLGAIDEAIVRRAALNIALERAGERRAVGIEWHTIEAFTGSLIRGERVAVRDRAEALGIRLDAPRVVCLVATRKPGGVLGWSPQFLSKTMTGSGSPSVVMAAASDNDVALILELPDGLDQRAGIAWAKDRLSRGLVELADPAGLHVAVSTVVREPDGDAKAHTEARQVLACMRNHLNAPGDHVLAVDDLGAGRLLLASADHTEAKRFAQDALGPLLAPDDHKARELLITLSVFLQVGRSVQRSARLLGVHPNTIRYRAANIERLTGLAVTTDDDAHLTAQLALLILRLDGRLPLIPPAEPTPPGSRDPHGSDGGGPRTEAEPDQ